MSSPLIFYSLLLLFSAGISLASAAWTWSRFQAQGATAFILLNLGSVIFSLGALMEAHSTDVSGMWGSITLRYLGTAALGPLWLNLVLALSGSSFRQTKPSLLLLFCFPVSAVLLAATSSFHTLFFTRVFPGVEAGFRTVQWEYGTFGWVYLFYQVVSVASSGAVLTFQAFQHRSRLRTQLLSLLGVSLIGAVGLTLRGSGWRTFGMDLSPVLMSLSGGLMAVFLHQTRLLDLPPLHTYRLTESLKEGLALFDSHGHLLGFNPAMARIHPFFVRENLGSSPSLREDDRNLEELLLTEPIRTLEISGGQKEGRRVFQVNRSPLRGRLGEPSGHIILLSDVTSRVEAAEKLSFLARTDELTGIANRRYFFERLREEADRCSRYGGSFGLAIFDLDHFKSFNDTWGHDVGDAVLRRAVKIWEGCLRTSDLLARYGGEEFGLLIPGAGIAESLQLLERMNRSLQYQDTPDGDPRLKITASAGLASYAPGEDIHELIRRADEALYEAKNRGRNRICVAPDRQE